MKKNSLFFIFFVISIASIIAESISIDVYGNAHVLSHNDLKNVLSRNWTLFTANNLYRGYENLRNSCGNNELLFEKKKETDFANNIIRISGNVKRVRKSVLNEYIVELYTPDSMLADIGVVYPKLISQAMINELMNYKQGDYFEAVVITRSTYLYVDVPVWNQNGVYRTEP